MDIYIVNGTTYTTKYILSYLGNLARPDSVELQIKIINYIFLGHISILRISQLLYIANMNIGTVLGGCIRTETDTEHIEL